MVALLLILVGSSYPQSYGASVIDLSGRDTLDIEDLIGELDVSDAEHAYMSEWLEELLQTPLDINRADFEDLIEIPFMSATEAISIVRHRLEYGPFTSADSLASIRGLDPLIAKRLRPFVVVGAPEASSGRTAPSAPEAGGGTSTPVQPAREKRITIQGDVIQRWTRKLELADGFRRDSSGYMGTPDILQTRLRIRVGKFSTGVTLDKDAGEPMRWEPASAQFGYDFAVGHLAISDVGWIRRLVIGDYSIRFASGNILRSPGGIGSSASSSAIRGSSVRPFASSAETGHFRGVAVELEPGRHLTLSGFASRTRFDARLDSTSGPDDPLLLRRSTGLHRTETENVGRQALSETTAGGGIRLTIGPLVVAGMAYMLEDRLDPRRLPGAPAIRRRTTIGSLATALTLSDFHLMAEIAPHGAISAVTEIRARQHGLVRIRYRRSGMSAYRPHSAYSSGSHGRTEPITQAAIQLRVQPTRRTSIELHVQHTHRSVRSNRRPFASTQAAGTVEIRHQIRPWFTGTLYTAQRHTEDGAVCSTTRAPYHTLRCVSAASRRSIRLQLEYKHSRSIESRTRIEYVTAGAASSRPVHGTLLYHDIRLHPTPRVSLFARVSRFSIDDHAARIYAYENDLLYSFSSPSFSGRGRRSYILLRLKPTRNVSLEMKWSSTIWEDVKSVGSGRDEIHGNAVREIRLQLRWLPFQMK